MICLNSHTFCSLEGIGTPECGALWALLARHACRQGLISEGSMHCLTEMDRPWPCAQNIHIASNSLQETVRCGVMYNTHFLCPDLPRYCLKKIKMFVLPSIMLADLRLRVFLYIFLFFCLAGLFVLRTLDTKRVELMCNMISVQKKNRQSRACTSTCTYILTPPSCQHCTGKSTAKEALEGLVNLVLFSPCWSICLFVWLTW